VAVGKPWIGMGIVDDISFRRCKDRVEIAAARIKKGMRFMVALYSIESDAIRLLIELIKKYNNSLLMV